MPEQNPETSETNSMNKDLAAQIIAEALDLAIRKGCYGLTETTNIVNAIAFLNSNNGQK